MKKLFFKLSVLLSLMVGSVFLSCSENNLELPVNGYNHIDAKVNNQEISLYEVIPEGKTNLIKHLIAKGSDVNTKNNKRWTPLPLEAAKGSGEYIKIIIKADAGINAKNNKEYNSYYVWKKRTYDSSY